MTPRAHRVLRRLHAAAIVAIGVTVAGILFDQPRLALAAVIPALAIVVVSLEALRAVQPEKEHR